MLLCLRCLIYQAEHHGEDVYPSPGIGTPVDKNMVVKEALMMAIPQTITSSILNELSLFSRRDRSNIFPLQRLRREAEKLKSVSLAQYYTIRGAIACIEFDTEGMHSFHVNAIEIGSSVEVVNYIASLEKACLMQDAFVLAMEAYRKDENDFGALNRAMDMAAKNLRFRELQQLVQAWHKFCPGEEHPETEVLDAIISFMDAHNLSDDETSTLSRRITNVLHSNGVIIVQLKYGIDDDILAVDYDFVDEHLSLRSIFAEVEASLSDDDLFRSVRIGFNGKRCGTLTTRDEVAERIFSDWGDVPPAHVSLKLLDFILENEVSSLCHLTYASIRKVIGCTFQDVHVFEALQYLTGDRVPLLRTGFEFIDADEHIFQISPAELSEARKAGEFIHPGTGEPVDDFEANILFYFFPGPLVQQLFQE